MFGGFTPAQPVTAKPASEDQRDDVRVNVRIMQLIVDAIKVNDVAEVIRLANLLVVV